MMFNRTPKEVFNPAALLYVMCGNVGTGKTTYRKELVAYIKALGRTVVVVNADEILLHLDGGTYQEYTQTRHDIMTEIQRIAVTLTGEDQAFCGFDPEKSPTLIVDNMNYTKAHRTRILGYAVKGCKNREKALYTSILLDLGSGDENTLKRRIEGRKDLSPQKWEEVHSGIKKVWEPPSCEEGYTEIFRIECVEGPHTVGTHK